MLARVLGFEQSSEGLGRQRILELRSRSNLGRLCPAEQDELDKLRKLYPDLPLEDTAGNNAPSLPRKDNRFDQELPSIRGSKVWRKGSRPVAWLDNREG